MTFKHPARQHERYGRGSHVIDVDDLGDLGPQDLEVRLRELFASPDYQPPVLPAAAFELMEVSRRPDVSLAEAKRVLEQDPLLASNVLKVAQSPAYATRAPLQSLDDAVSRLGINGVRDVVWQVVMGMRVFRVPGYSDVMSHVQRHCVATGHIARAVCGYTAVANSYAFLCGLLHDVGICGVLIAISEGSGGKPPAIDTLWPTIDEVHMECGGQIARLWKLNPDIQIVLSQHHRFDRSLMPHPLIATITVAEHLAQRFGWPLIPDNAADDLGFAVDGVREERLEAAYDSLGITAAIMKLLEQDVERLQQRLSGDAP